MKRLWKELWDLIKRPSFALPLILTLAIGYGYVVLHTAVGVDDLARGDYLKEAYYLRTGRLWGYLLLLAEGEGTESVFAQQVISVLLMGLSAALFTLWLGRSTDGKLKPACQSVFACLFVSYPIIAKLWVFDAAVVAVSLNYCLSALELMLLQSFFRGERRYWKLAAAAGMLWVGYSLYQSHALVYVTGVLLYLTLRGAYGGEAEARLKTILARGCVCILPLAAGLLADQLAVALTLKLLHLEKVEYYGYGIAYFSGAPLGETLRRLGVDLLRTFGFNGLYYLPIGVLQCAVAAGMILTGVFAAGHKRPGILFSAVLSCLSLILLPLIQGWFVDYRNYQQLALFTALALTLLLQWALVQWRRTWLKNAAAAALALLCLWQTADLSRWFRLDDRRDQEERRVLELVYQDLTERFDVSGKPVVFLNTPQPSEELRRAYTVRLENRRLRFLFPEEEWPAEVQINNFYQGGTDPCILLNYMGCGQLHNGSVEQYAYAGTLSPGLPWYPEEGYITQTQDFILVKLGPLFED